MIVVTGDLHGRVKNDADNKKIFNEKNFPPHFFDNNNYLIVVGDFGCVWSEETLKSNIDYFSQFKGTILFCDGNNDNNDMLNKMPVSMWNGGKVHAIAPNIIHLMRGEVYEIEGLKFFAFGGADSWDRNIAQRRHQNINWWASERPTKTEFENALKNLKKYNNKVDFVITHETTSDMINKHFSWNIPENVNGMLDEIYNKIQFRHWFFGHHHYDKEVKPHMSIIYNNIKVLDKQSYPTFKFCTFENDKEELK